MKTTKQHTANLSAIEASDQDLLTEAGKSRRAGINRVKELYISPVTRDEHILTSLATGGPGQNQSK